MEAGFRKRVRQHSTQDNDSDTEMGSNADSKEFDGKRGALKGPGKQNHSEIEKRRRDKMNTYINELSSMIPMCNAMSRKLDKLTVLRMAVQHMRALRGSSTPVSESNYKPAFLSDEDLKNLVLESADGFLVVVGCDRGRILYVSDSVNKVLFQQQSDLVGQNFFDLVHPKDMATVKDQVSFMEVPPRVGEKSQEKEIIKGEEKQVSKLMRSGARRSFMCRMKCGIKVKKLKGIDDNNTDLYIMNKKAKLNKSSTTSEKKRFIMVHFTGYLKSWPPTSIAIDEDDEDQESKNLSCLIAVGREIAVADLNTNFSLDKFPTEFVSRHSVDGKFIYLDQRVTAICGYLPQEMIGMSAYDFFHPGDIKKIAESHKNTLESDTSLTQPYRFLCKEGHYVYLLSKSTVFHNPWTKEREFIICINTVDTNRANPIVRSNISHPRPILPAQDSQAIVSLAGLDGGHQNQRTFNEVLVQEEEQVQGIDSHGPAKIGSSIAEEVQGQSNTQRGKHHNIMMPTTSNTSSDRLSLSSSNPGTSSTNVMEKEQSNRENSSQGDAINTSSTNIPRISQPHLLEQLIGMQQAIESMESPLEQNEETMAMFMNMLEADAGLGGDLNEIVFQ